MKPASIVLPCVTLLLLLGSASAQQAVKPHAAAGQVSAVPSSPSDVSLSDMKMTPEMWFYLQDRQRYDTPKYNVHRNAEVAASQRAERLAAKKWLGQSSQRPSVYATPFGSYFPGAFPYGGADRWNIYLSVRGNATPLR